MRAGWLHLHMLLASWPCCAVCMTLNVMSCRASVTGCAACVAAFMMQAHHWPRLLAWHCHLADAHFYSLPLPPCSRDPAAA